jgi:hypothetical protein
MSTSVVTYADTPRVADTGPGVMGLHQNFPEGQDFCRARAQWGLATDGGAGRTEFRFQSDGNLVLYLRGVPKWASWTDDRGSFLCFQHDGNMVVYDGDGVALWDSHTWGHPGSPERSNRLEVQDDGNVVIYDQSQWLWETHTFH